MASTTLSINTYSPSPLITFLKKSQTPNFITHPIRRTKPLKFSIKSDPETEQQTIDNDTRNNTEFGDNQQELDWKTDEEFKKFMGNPSIEAAIKLEKKRADRKLKELDRESSSDNLIVGVLNKVVRDRLAREKERLEEVEEVFKALDLNKVI